MQVFGETPSDYICSAAGFGVDGDRQGWEDFLAKASEIFYSYGDISFVHWATQALRRRHRPRRASAKESSKVVTYY